MPNRENIRKWVAALRSGKYKQGTGALRNSADEYCCLGVACELAGEDGVDVDRKRRPIGPYTYQGLHGYLPAVVADWLGAGDEPPEFSVDGELDVAIGFYDETDDDGEHVVMFASTANDDLGWDFNQIADAIEKKYLATADA